MLAGRPELHDMVRCRRVPEHSHTGSPTHTLSPLPHTKRSHHMHPTHRAGLSPSWAKLGISGIHLHHKWQIKMNGALPCMGHDTMQPFTPCNAMQSGTIHTMQRHAIRCHAKTKGPWQCDTKAQASGSTWAHVGTVSMQEPVCYYEAC